MSTERRGAGSHAGAGARRSPPAVGIKDVAALAGVSVGTVSNVLNRPGSVSVATRGRVEAAIAELGFVRNESARQLRAGRSRVLAYLVPDAANPFFIDVARGVEGVAGGAGLAVFLCNSDQHRSREDEYLSQLLEQRVRGVLITPVDTGSDRLADFARRGVPVVLVDRAANGGPGGCSVAVDDVAGGEMAAAHLMELGHRDLAFVGGPLSLIQVRDRLRGCRRAAAGADGGAAAVTVVEVAALSIAEGRAAGTRLAAVPAGRRPTAVVCANDLLALGMLQELTRSGVRVPADISIVGYDDIAFAEAATVPLTSVRQPRELLGRTAAELLLAETDADHLHRQVVFEPTLVVRESTGPPVRTRR